MSKRQDIADTKQSWCWLGMGWTCYVMGILTGTFEGMILGFATGISANIVGTYVGVRRYWRKK